MGDVQSASAQPSSSPRLNGAGDSAKSEPVPEDVMGGLRDKYRWKVESADQFKPQPINWLINGVLPHSALGFLAGDSRSLKTFIAVDMACCIATGRPWQGRPVKQGPVLYICGEGRSGFGRRLEAWRKKHGLQRVDIQPLFIADPIDLADQQFCRYVHHEISLMPVKPLLIVVDTLARNSSANENDTTEVNNLINRIDDQFKSPFSCHVLVIHHNNKSGGFRGSSTMMGNVDVFLTATRQGTESSDQDELSMVTVLKNPKMKDAPEFEPITLQASELELGTDEHGVVMTSLVLSTTVLVNQDKRKSHNDSECLQMAKILYLLCESQYSQRKLSDITGYSRSAIQRSLVNADDDSLVTKAGKGKQVMYMVKPAGKRLVERFKATLDQWDMDGRPPVVSSD